MLWRISTAVGLVAIISLIGIPAISDNQAFHTWPPANLKSTEPRYDLSVPKINSALGRNNQPVSPFKPTPVDQAYINNYHAANRLYKAGSRAMTALPYKPGHWVGVRRTFPLDKRLERATDLFNHARLQYEQFQTHRARLEFPWLLKNDPDFKRSFDAWQRRQLSGWKKHQMTEYLEKAFPKPLSIRKVPYPHYNADYRWRMKQIAAAAKIGRGNIGALTPGESIRGHYIEALGLYGAVRIGQYRRHRFLTEDPVPVKVTNQDDRRLIAQAHNNLGTAILSNFDHHLYQDMTRDKFPAEYDEKTGRLIVKDADLKRYLATKLGQGYLARYRVGLDNLRAALRYWPDNKLYFFNLFNALMTFNLEYCHLVDQTRFLACALLLFKMKKVLRDPAGRRALAKTILASNRCLDPAQDPGDDERPSTKPPAAAAPDQKKPPLTGKGQKVKPPPRCGPAIAGKTDCVRKRIEGH